MGAVDTVKDDGSCFTASRAAAKPRLPNLKGKIDFNRKKAVINTENCINNRVIAWRRHPDSNWRIKVLQTFALPLGYGAILER